MVYVGGIQILNLHVFADAMQPYIVEQNIDHMLSNFLELQFPQCKVYVGGIPIPNLHVFADVMQPCIVERNLDYMLYNFSNYNSPCIWFTWDASRFLSCMCSQTRCNVALLNKNLDRLLSNFLGL
jgi:hypothetical protein